MVSSSWANLTLVVFRVLRLWVFVTQPATTLLYMQCCSAAVPALHGIAQFSRHAMTILHGNIYTLL